MRLYWDYVWYGGNEYYKVLCIETKYNSFELIRFKIDASKYKHSVKMEDF